jgi:pimeloyl-ACP methyl ester carboxylesterase
VAEETVILIHGIWTNGMEMSLLRKRLSTEGYITQQFTYRSVQASPSENALELASLARSINTPVIHFVCHSLGGLILRHMFVACPEQKTGRVVTLGTPHQASSAARQLSRFSLGRLLLGQSVEQGLLGQAPPWRTNHELGVIAGTLQVGVGMIIPGIPTPNDGTVAVKETELPGMKDHITLFTSHTGMLLSHKVFQQAVYFLRHGLFKH